MPPTRVFCLLPKRKFRPTRQLTVSDEHQIVPLLFTFVGDVSESMRENDKHVAVQDAVIAIVENILKNEDKMELITFSNEPKVQTGLKRKLDINADTLKEQLTPNGRMKALFDAIGTSIDHLEKKERYWRFQREMVVLTHGMDNNSCTKYRDLTVLKALIRSPDVENFHITIIGVGVEKEYVPIFKALCNGIRHATYINCEDSRDAIRDSFREACQIIEHNRFLVRAKLFKNRPVNDSQQASSSTDKDDNTKKLMVNASSLVKMVSCDYHQSDRLNSVSSIDEATPINKSLEAEYLNVPCSYQMKKLNSSPDLANLFGEIRIDGNN